MATGTYTPGANDILHTVEVNFESRELIPTPVHVVQYDKKIPILEVVLYKGDAPYVVPSSATVNIRFRKPDGHIVNNPAIGLNANRTIVYFQVTYQMSSKDGDALAIVEVDLGNSGSGGSGAFRVIVERNPVQEGDIESTDEMLNIQGYVDQAKQYAEASKYAIQIGNTTTGNPGTPARVVNRGTAQNAILEFTIPRGLDGSLDDPTALLGGDVWLLKGGISLQSGDDLNDYTEVGNYYSVGSQNILNLPIDASSPFYIKVQKCAGRIIQTLRFVWSIDLEYVRYYQNNSWTNWKTTGHNLINNLTTAEPGKGSLDAYQGYLLNLKVQPYLNIPSGVTKIEDLPYGFYNLSTTKMRVFTDFPGTATTSLIFTSGKNLISDERSVLMITVHGKMYIGKKYGSSEPLFWQELDHEYLKDNYKSLTQFTEIPSGADLKSATYLVPGNYCCAKDSIASTLVNCPISGSFTLEVSAGNGRISEVVKQTFISFNGIMRVERVKMVSSNVWGTDCRYISGTGLAYTDAEVASGTIGSDGYLRIDQSLERSLVSKAVLTTLRGWATGMIYNVCLDHTKYIYLIGEPNSNFTNVRIRLWYRP